MNFGIMAMQLNELIPPGQSPEQIVSSLAQFSHAALVRRLAAAGFNWIELGGDLALFLPQAFTPQAIQELGALKEELSLNYTVHLPLWSIEASTPLQPVRTGSIEAIVQCIRAVQPLQPAVYVLHATGALAAEFYRMRLPEAARALILRQFQANAQRSLQEILDQTGLATRQLAIETIEFPFELTLELAEAVDVSMCLDTGHVLVGFSGEVDLFTALERCASRLAEIHLHDGPWFGRAQQIGYGKDHQALGKGDLDIPRLLRELERLQFQGPVIFELSVPLALESLHIIHSYRPRPSAG